MSMLTIDEAAARLRMSTKYVRRLIADRKIAFHKFGRSVRLADSDLRAFAATGRVEPMTSGAVWAELRRVS